MDQNIMYGMILVLILELVFMVITVAVSIAMCKKRWAVDIEMAIARTKSVLPAETIKEPAQAEPQPTEPKAEPKEETETEVEKLQRLLKEAEEKLAEKPIEITEEKKEHPKPADKKAEKPDVFFCIHKDCAKEFPTEDKMKRHYGMAHWKDIRA